MNLTAIPTEALQAELSRRWQGATLELPGLTVDPENRSVTYQGQKHHVIGRCLEVITALAEARLWGRTRVPSGELVELIWPRDDEASGLACLRATVTYVNKRVPGLVVLSRGYGGYGLRLEPGR